MDNSAHRGVNRQCNGAGDGVVGFNKLHLKAADFYLIPRINGIQLRFVEFVLLKLIFNKRTGKLCAVHGRINTRKHIRKRADMIFMSVSYKVRPYLIAIALQICHIRDDKINSVHVLPREYRTAINNHDVVSVLDGRHILSDLINATQRNNPQLCIILFFCH